MVVMPLAKAEWSGVSLSLNEVNSDWLFESGRRNAEISRLDLQFEEKTPSGLGVGANIGQITTRVSDLNGPRNTRKFDGSYLGVYLRYPVPLGEFFSLHSKLAYQYHSATQIDSSVYNQIETRDIGVELGLSGRFSNLRVTAFAAYNDVSGDISGDTGTEIFENEESVSSGISFDLFVESSGYIRLRMTRGEQDSASLSFAREF
ncbi:MAG: hypothetical protein OEY09_09105 [Gammaproteobacteria bacterium]|nr:hypothetical protein [Gammaproteobacteria bacterium]